MTLSIQDLSEQVNHNCLSLTVEEEKKTAVRIIIDGVIHEVDHTEFCTYIDSGEKNRVFFFVAHSEENRSEQDPR